jgi:hypothetical protein
MKISPIVLLLALFVYVVQRKMKTKKPSPVSDGLRDTIQENVKVDLPWYVPYVLAVVPLYLGYNHDEFPKIFEHGLVLWILFLAVRTFQLLNNPTSRGPVEFTSPAVNLMMLLYVYHGILERKSAYLYTTAQAVTVLLLKNYTTTSKLIDDSVLAHLLFYLFKY